MLLRRLQALLAERHLAAQGPRDEAAGNIEAAFERWRLAYRQTCPASAWPWAPGPSPVSRPKRL